MYDDMENKMTAKEQFDVSFEAAFGEFYSGGPLEGLFEKRDSILYQMLRLAFLSGFQAAGGKVPPEIAARFTMPVL